MLVFLFGSVFLPISLFIAKPWRYLGSEKTAARGSSLHPTSVGSRESRGNAVDEAERKAERRADSRALKRLEKDLEVYLESRPGTVGVFARLEDGASLNIRGDAQFPSASLIKIPIALAVFDEAEDGKIGLSERLIVPNVNPDFGGQAVPEGSEVEVQKLIDLMLGQSDNAAANALIDRIGINRINGTISSVGANGTKLRRKMLDMDAISAGVENVTTPKDMVLMLEKIKRRKALTPSHCDLIIGALRLNAEKEMIASLRGRTVTHKSGVMNSPSGFNVGDAAIVETNGRRFYLAILTSRQPSEREGKATIEGIAEMVVDYFSGEPEKGSRKWKVCLDPGHQREADLGEEPIAPGSSQKKPKSSGGAIGVATGVPEYEFALKLSKKVKNELERKGVEVVITRESNDVRLSNIDRARLAIRERADLFLRIHADSSGDSSQRGISTLYPADNSWTRSIYAESLRAARIVQDSLVKSEGRPDRGILPRSDLSGFNWSNVPSILVEVGFLSNPEEDRLLNDEVHQQKIAKAMAKGVLRYLSER